MSGCGCGCPPIRSVSAMTRRRLRRVAGASARAIGDAMSDASSLAQTFQATDYIPADIQNDYATGLAYYQQFKNATAGVSVSGGTVQLSDAAADQLLLTTTQTVFDMVPVLGQVFAVFMALSPKAGPGPGTCADPPAGPAPSQLRAWPHYTSWASFFGPYPQAAAGTFESYANGVLQYNWELGANCFMSKWAPAPGLLAALVASWNATHAGPARTVTRTGLNPTGWGLPKGYDPIASALEDAIIAKSAGPPPTTGPLTFAQSDAAAQAAPHNATSSFSVNSGAMLTKTITLKLKPPPAPVKAAAPAPVKAAAPAPASSGATAALVATVALAGAAGVWIFVRRRKRLPVVPTKLANKLPKSVRRAFRG
jgi:hypothetical protein